MTSAWGSSWASAWGNSWGSVSNTSNQGGWGGNIWGKGGGGVVPPDEPTPVLVSLTYAQVAANRPTPQNQGQSSLASELSDGGIPTTTPTVNLP